MIEQSAYGKSRVRLVTIDRHQDRHDIVDLTVAVRFEGDFDASYVDGDNARVLPTDTMKNTVYALAAERGVGDAESFGMILAAHFLQASGHLRRVTIDLAQQLWDRIDVSGGAHPHAFVKHGPETRTAVVTADRTAVRVDAGVDALVVLKSAASAFEGFPRDRFTTLSETSDRLLATSLTATWRYARTGLAYDDAWRDVRQTLLATFAGHGSRSVQHTLYRDGACGSPCPRRTGVDPARHAQPASHSLRCDPLRDGESQRGVRRHRRAVRPDRSHDRQGSVVSGGSDPPGIRKALPGVLAVAVMLAAGSIGSAEDDLFTGTWRLLVDRSTFDPGPALVSSRVTIAAIPGGRRVTTDNVAADGRTIHTSYAAKFDGGDHPLSGSAAIDTVALRRIDSRTLERTDKKDGRVVTTYQLQISEDGGTMTITMNGMSTMGQPVRNLLIYARL